MTADVWKAAREARAAWRLACPDGEAEEQRRRMLPAWREKAIVEIFLRLPRIILVDSEETYLLGYRVCDSGIRLEVSGPESLLMHEHTVTECDGSPLVLRRD